MRTRFRVIRVLPLVVGLFGGCATSLSTFQPAHVAPRGGVQIEAGVDISAPVGSLTKAVDAGKTALRAAENRMLTSSEANALLDAGTMLATNPPGAIFHAGLAYGVTNKLELGLRATSGAWRLGGRYQLLDQAESGWDLSIGLGVQRYKYEFPINNVLDVLVLEDYSRWTLDVPLLLGRHGTWYRFWGGPRLLASTFDTRLVLSPPPVAGVAPPATLATLGGHGLFAGGQVGGALGYKAIFLALELTVVRFYGTAELTAGTARRDVDLGTWIVYPGIALMSEF